MRLFLDDVDEMVAMLSKFGDVTATSADFSGPLLRGDDLSVLSGPEVRESLRLTAGEPDRRLTVGVAGPAYVEQMPADDLELSGAAQRIGEIFDRRWRAFGALSMSLDVESPRDLIGIILGVAVGLSSGSIMGDGDFSTKTRVLVGVGVYTWVLLGTGFHALFGRNKRPRATLVLAYEADAPSWWRVNRTAILLGLATNAVVGAVFFVLGLAVGGD